MAQCSNGPDHSDADVVGASFATPSTRSRNSSVRSPTRRSGSVCGRRCTERATAHLTPTTWTSSFVAPASERPTLSLTQADRSSLLLARSGPATRTMLVAKGIGQLPGSRSSSSVGVIVERTSEQGVRLSVQAVVKDGQLGSRSPHWILNASSAFVHPRVRVHCGMAFWIASAGRDVD